MAELTVLVSGPVGQRQAAIGALTGAGFEVDPKVNHGHGHPDRHDGSSDETIGWVTAAGDDIDQVLRLVEPLGWALRSHWGEPLLVSPLLVDVPNPLEGRIAELERALEEMRSR